MTRELALVVACCAAAFGGCDRPVSCEGIGWSKFVRLARFHRVQGLVWNGLKSSGIDAEALALDAQSIVATNLRIAREARALKTHFDEAGISLLFVKGLTLGALAYPNPPLKMGWDIDLLVAPEDLSQAGRILAECGYRPELPSNLSKLGSWHRRHKESVWRQDDLYVELHTQLADNPSLIPTIDVRSCRQDVEVATGITLPTFATDELFAYLCIHGASSAWFRLKWITDLAALIHGLPAAEIERLYERSQELGAYRAADQALLLADVLYGSLDGTNLREKLHQTRSSRILFEAALNQLNNSSEPTERRLGTWRIHWTQLLLKRGLGFKAGEALRQVRTAVA